MIDATAPGTYQLAGYDITVGQSYTALAETAPGEPLFAIRHNHRRHTPGSWLTGEGRSWIYPLALRPSP